MKTIKEKVLEKLSIFKGDDVTYNRLCKVIDLTEELKTEQILKEIEKWYKEKYKGIPDMFYPEDFKEFKKIIGDFRR